MIGEHIPVMYNGLPSGEVGVVSTLVFLKEFFRIFVHIDCI
jgi:hypothetical protein